MKEFFKPYVEILKDYNCNTYDDFAYNYDTDFNKTIDADFNNITKVINSGLFDINKEINILHYIEPYDGISYYKIEQDNYHILVKAKTHVDNIGGCFSGFIWGLCFTAQIHHIINMEKLAAMFKQPNIHFNLNNIYYLYAHWLLIDPTCLDEFSIDKNDEKRLKNVFTKEIPPVKTIYETYKNELIKHYPEEFFKYWDSVSHKYNYGFPSPLIKEETL